MKIVLLSLISCFSFSVSAQKSLLNTLGGAAKKKVEQQDFNSTRTNKEKLNDDNKKSSPAPSSAPAETIDSANVPAVDAAKLSGGKYKESYSFSQMVTYKMEDLKGKNREPHLMTSYYSDGAVMTKSDANSDMNMIYDVENESMIMINEKDITVMVMSSKMMNGMAAKEVDKNGELKITKTGNTKLILGHTCEEYIMEDDKNKTICWVTTEIKLKFTKMMSSSMGKGMNANYQEKMKEFSDGGMMMEMTSYNKKGEAETHMIMTEFKEEAVLKSLSGYAVTVL